MANLEDLKRRVQEYRTQQMRQKAKLEQLELQKKEQEDYIRTKFGVDPEKLEEVSKQNEQEIHILTAEIEKHLNLAQI